MSDLDHLPAEQSFAIGEIALWVRPGPNYGLEVTIAGPLGYYESLDTDTGKVVRVLGYKLHRPTSASSGPYANHSKLVNAPFQYLRKLRPPREDLQVVRWAECPWQPQQVQA